LKLLEIKLVNLQFDKKLNLLLKNKFNYYSSEKEQTDDSIKPELFNKIGSGYGILIKELY